MVKFPLSFATFTEVFDVDSDQKFTQVGLLCNLSKNPKFKHGTSKYIFILRGLLFQLYNKNCYQ